MTKITRRRALEAMAASSAAACATAAPRSFEAPSSEAPQPNCLPTSATNEWARGIEGQRKADLGNGTFLNPIMAGDHPDPTILKDGEDYYMTFSSFDAYPGIIIWHSKDLINWQPLGPALHTPIGSVWACELVKHEGRYYIYIPARSPRKRSIYVIYADEMTGPWSEPIDLHLPNHIDPGHAVGEDGQRYLFLSNGDRVRLRSDGLATAGPVEHVYDPWRYPEDWVTESFSPEGPKIYQRGEWFYMILAVGGTAGPPTGHMVVLARSRSIHGPWEDAPHNPVVRTQSTAEKWWSRGHATLVEGPGDTFFLVYHGYENGYWTLGRQALLDPIVWTEDGWFRVTGGDLSSPLPKPEAFAVPHGVPLSDDFSQTQLRTHWAFYDPGPSEMNRLRFEEGGLVLRAKGEEPYDCSPLTFIVGDQHYLFEADLEIEDNARGGVLLFYSRRLYCGLGFDTNGLVMHRYGLERRLKSPPGLGRKLSIRLENNHHIVTIHYAIDGVRWTKFGTQMEVSGYHHNVAYDFLSLRPGCYASGEGQVRIHSVRYQAG
ncbi:MAG: family 43 glycosylhydrolase [Myxococcales bacterium]|nr:family 43 glycosylhydrolase [Myxococcales bacterium]